MEQQSLQVKIFSQTIQCFNNEPMMQERNQGYRQKITPSLGSVFQVDRDLFQSKVSKKGFDSTFLSGIKSIAYDLQILPTSSLKQDEKQRLLTLKLNGKELLCLKQTSQNRLILSSQHSEQPLHKKSKFNLNEWNQLTLLIQRTEDKDLISLSSNGQLRGQMSLTQPLEASLEDILVSTQIVLCGNNEEDQDYRSLFHGLIRDLKVTLKDSLSPKSDHIKSEKLDRIVPNLKENNDRFTFINSLYDLEKFDPSKWVYHQSTVPLVKREPRDRKIMICHDIGGGILEERFTQGLYPSSITQATDRCYRFHQWANIDSFIYFGHYRVTIPPPAYVNIAHKNGVQIFGTLIFEWEEGGKEATSMLDGMVGVKGTSSYRKHPDGNRFYARKLAQIMKSLGFDGYLMNFECDLTQEQTDTLLVWLAVLREEMHSAVEGSVLVWYDSVLIDGALRWQSALNSKNYPFFRVSDAFFTDYHWKLQNLEVTLECFNKEIKEQCPHLSTYDIYYGNDVYGRGTYGGGQFDTWKAIKEIKKYPFSIAVFGQGYLNDVNCGYASDQIFNLNEDMWWLGKQIVKIADSVGKVYNVSQTGKHKLFKDWNVEEGHGKWSVNESRPTSNLASSDSSNVSSSGGECETVASFNPCIKKLIVPITELIHEKIVTKHSDIKALILVGKVKGLPPNYEDTFKHSLRVLNGAGEIISEKNYSSDFSKCASDGSWTSIYMKMEIQNVVDIQNDSVIEVYIEGKDAEYWGGHYGSVFAGEGVFLEVDTGDHELTRDKNLQQQFGLKTIICESAITSFNRGFGQAYYVDGKLEVKGNWNNLKEYDLYFLQNSHGEVKSKNGQNVNYLVTDEGNHFNAGSSFRIKGNLESEDIATVVLSEIDLKSTQNFFDLKIAFQVEPVSFQGNVSFIIGMKNGEHESFEIHSQELKESQAIYKVNGWNVYEVKMIELNPDQVKHLSLQVESKTSSQFTVNLGIIALTPTNQAFEVQFSSLDCQVIDQVTPAAGKRLCDLHFSWNTAPEHSHKAVQLYRIYRLSSEKIQTPKEETKEGETQISTKSIVEVSTLRGVTELSKFYERRAEVPTNGVITNQFDQQIHLYSGFIFLFKLKIYILMIRVIPTELRLFLTNLKQSQAS